MPLTAWSQGAIYTTDRFGQHVDGNYHLRKGSIYLVGGPGEGVACNLPGLPDGNYYFAVMDPSGRVLLSPDSIEDRHVLVSGGVIAAYLGTTHNSGGIGPCGSIFVQVMPFAETSLFGGEYKIWLTRVGDYDPQGTGLHGFDPRKSKSTNFKLRHSGPALPQSIIRGRAYYDHDQNGVWNPQTDPLEVPLGGWRVDSFVNGVQDGLTFADQDGWYTFIRERDGSTRTLVEKAPGGYVGDGISGASWVATTPRTGTVVTAVEQIVGPLFGNVLYEVAPGSGRPVSFWIGDGKPLLESADPSWRVALNVYDEAPINLRNPVSNDNPSASIFTLNSPPESFRGAFANWKAFVDKTSHDHAGFLLSRQVAAAILNNRFGFMQGSLLVDRFQDGILVPFDTLLSGAIGLLSQVGAGLTGPNDPYQALRAMMIACTNEFGSINETGDLANPQVVYRRAEMPPTSVFTPFFD